MIVEYLDYVVIHMFVSCDSLASVTLSPSLSSIGATCFADCPLLENVFALNPAPGTGGSNMFRNFPSTLAIYVPEESVSAYETANGWQAYAAFIVGGVSSGGSAGSGSGDSGIGVTDGNGYLWMRVTHDIAEQYLHIFIINVENEFLVLQNCILYVRV